MNLTLLLKFVSCVVIFVIGFIGGIIPIRLQAWFSSPKTLSLANCLSAGILLGASLIHLLFDAEYKKFDYPFAHLCAGVGFFLAFILEKIIFSHDHGAGEGHGHKKDGHKKEKKKEKKKSKKHKKTADEAELVMLNQPEVVSSSTLELPTLNVDGIDDTIARSASQEFTEMTPRPSHPVPSSPTPSSPSSMASLSSLKYSINELEQKKTEDIYTIHSGPIMVALDEESVTSIDPSINDDGLRSTHQLDSSTLEKKSLWKKMQSSPHKSGYILMSVLALESIISGSALGIADEGLGVIVIMIAIVTHIWAEAFALTAAFLKSNMEVKKINKLLISFCAVTPFGVIMGACLQSVLEGETAILISSLLISVAAGTFLYIAIVEVIAEEFESGEDKWKKLNLLLLGFAFMSGLAAFI